MVDQIRVGLAQLNGIEILLDILHKLDGDT